MGWEDGTINIVIFSLIGLVLMLSLLLLIKRHSTATEQDDESEKRVLFQKACLLDRDAILIVDRSRRVIFANAAARQFDPDLMLQQPISQFDHNLRFRLPDTPSPLTLKELLDKHRTEKSTDRSLFREVALEERGSTVSVEIQSYPSQKSRQIYDILVIRDQNCEAKLATLQYLNPISGLPNQYKAFGDITKITTQQGAKANFEVLMLELDQASELRAIYGYMELDNILNTISSVFRELQNDKRIHVYHLSYVNFMVLLEQPKNPDEILGIYQRFQNMVQQKYDINQQKQRLSFSAGIVRYSSNHGTLHDLLNYAYSALAKAQEQGTGQIVVAEESLQGREVEEEMQINNEIRDALENGEFSLYFQPIYDSKTRRLYGAETLIRWIHPERGFISPDLFIPIAERSGLIVEIGHYVIKEALKHLSSWNSFSMPPITLSVNLSLKDLETPDFISRLTELLYRYDIGESQLKIEITEHASMANPELTQKRLSEIRQLGIEISLDDFGTGYSSFAYLAKFPIRTLKIDKGFVQDLQLNPQHHHIVHAIIKLAHSLRMDIVAEGVETAEDAKLLQEMGADYLQGYYFSKPVPKLEFQYLLSHSADS